MEFAVWSLNNAKIQSMNQKSQVVSIPNGNIFYGKCVLGQKAAPTRLVGVAPTSLVTVAYY